MFCRCRHCSVMRYTRKEKHLSSAKFPILKSPPFENLSIYCLITWSVTPSLEIASMETFDWIIWYTFITTTADVGVNTCHFVFLPQVDSSFFPKFSSNPSIGQIISTLTVIIVLCKEELLVWDVPPPSPHPHDLPGVICFWEDTVEMEYPHLHPDPNGHLGQLKCKDP